MRLLRLLFAACLAVAAAADHIPAAEAADKKNAAAQGAPAAPGKSTQGAAARGVLAPELLSGRFTQEKTVAGLKKTLVSRGDFLVAKDKGVIWRTRKPFSAAFAITPKGIWTLREEGPAGSAPRREAVHKGKVDAALEMIQKALAGDRAALGRTFIVKEGGSPSAWTLDLKPKDRMVARFMAAIRLEGGTHVNLIDFQEANGDRTRITFTDVAENGGDLAAWQAPAFQE